MGDMKDLWAIAKSLSFFLAFILLLIVLGLVYRAYEKRHPSTYDATLQAAIISLSPDIAGRVNKVFFKNNMLVNAGDTLFTLEDVQQQSNYQQALANAQKSIDDYNRYAQLNKTIGTISAQNFENARIQMQIDTATLASKKDLLDHTRIRAAQSGVLANFYVQVGQYVTPGVSLGSLLITHSAWLQANILEPFLQYIKIGQPVNFSLRMYPGVHFKGIVEGIDYAIATDAQVSAGAPLANVPADYNWVYLPKRFPIRIKVLSANNAVTPFRVGASAYVEINTTKTL